MNFDQKQFDKDFNFMRTMHKVIFTFIFAMVIGIIAFNVWIGAKIYNEVDQNGLKSVIERVWEGPNGTVR